MPSSPPDPPSNRIETFDQSFLEARLREIISCLPRNRWIDEIELQHLIRVVTECSLLLTDVYSDDRLDRIMRPERGVLSNLVDRLIEEERSGEGEVFYRVRRLPEDVRVVGDRALFDLGVLGLSRVKGFDLEDLGSRAYRVAGELLELLADDRRLRQFFKHNRLLMLPLEDEVGFLRQCSERFQVYTEVLRRIHDRPRTAELDDLTIRVPLMAAVADALTASDAETPPDPAPKADPGDIYAEAARNREDAGSGLARDELLSVYERMVLFSALDLDGLRRGLRAVVIDQDEAVEALCDEFSLFAAGTRDLRKPPGYFLVGPTGVGKNHLVESLCRLLEGVWKVEVPLLTIEGPSYTYPSDINELKGATRGFIRSDEEGLLTRFHQLSSQAPFSVILVDEVEKAHPQLRTFFLSILDRGTVTDNRGQVLNFANSIVFFTSNLGYSDAQQRSAPIGYMDDDERAGVVDREIVRDLRKVLKPEFINRLRMIHFRRLGRDSVERILDLELDRIARRYREVHGIDLEVEPAAREELIRRGFSPRYGARHMASTLESVCNVEIAKRIRRDDRRENDDHREVVEWLRRLRADKEAIDVEEVRRRVLATTRARLDYKTLRITFDDGVFAYRPGDGGDEP